MLWSCLAKVDEVAVAPGKVVPMGQVKVVQPLEARQATSDAAYAAYLADALDRRAEAQDKADGLEGDIRKARQRAAERRLVAPMDGTVQVDGAGDAAAITGGTVSLAGDGSTVMATGAGATVDAAGQGNAVSMASGTVNLAAGSTASVAGSADALTQGSASGLTGSGAGMPPSREGHRRPLQADTKCRLQCGVKPISEAEMAA